MPDYQFLFAYTSFKFTLLKASFLVQMTCSIVKQQETLSESHPFGGLCLLVGRQPKGHHRLHPVLPLWYGYVPSSSSRIILAYCSSISHNHKDNLQVVRTLDIQYNGGEDPDN